jgi:hypothetical protein
VKGRKIVEAAFEGDGDNRLIRTTQARGGGVETRAQNGLMRGEADDAPKHAQEMKALIAASLAKAVSDRSHSAAVSIRRKARVIRRSS